MWTLVDPPTVAWLAVSLTFTRVAPADRLFDFASFVDVAVRLSAPAVPTSAPVPSEASVAPVIVAVALVSNGGAIGIGRSSGRLSAMPDSATPFRLRMFRLMMSVVACAVLLATADTVALRARTRPETLAWVLDLASAEVPWAPIVNRPTATSTMSGSTLSVEVAFTFMVPPPLTVMSALVPISASVSPEVFSAANATSPVNTAMPVKLASALPARAASAVTSSWVVVTVPSTSARALCPATVSAIITPAAAKADPAKPPACASGVTLAVPWIDTVPAETVALPWIAARAWPPVSAAPTAPLAAANALALKPTALALTVGVRVARMVSAPAAFTVVVSPSTTA